MSERTEAERRGRVERFRAELVKIFGGKYDANITVNGGCLEAVIEDLRLAAYEFTDPQTGEARAMVSLLGRCASCGAETLSAPFIDLAGLGRSLERFEPFDGHLCPARTPFDREKSED